MRRKAKLTKIIINDFYTFMLLLLSIFINVVWVYLYFINNQIYWFIVVLALIYLLVFLVRLTTIYKTINTGIEVSGEIIGVMFVKDRGRIEYSYKYQDVVYKSGNAIMKNKVTKEYKMGMNINLIMSRDNYKKVFIKELYL